MPLSWNEIKQRAIEFSKEWETEVSEDAEAKSFLDGFFNVFGISRRRVASFEKKVKKIDDRDGYIDLLWKGVILIEQKSRDKNLDMAYRQAIDYFPGLKEVELPKYVLVSDFERFCLYDLEENTEINFVLNEFVGNVQHFGFIAGYQKKTFKSEDPVNIEAAELMGRLHDKLQSIGYSGHQLELYLVRILFCLFADDTGIFEKNIFFDYILQKTNEDGSDLAAHLSMIFHNLNIPKTKRLKNLDESIDAFPYVNGKLFEETLPPAAFDSKMRNLLLDCCRLNWSKISPAIFGSLFQSVMDPEKRRNFGAHYTSETNILKLIKPLFLDDLWKKFEKLKGQKVKLIEFHNSLKLLRFLDPACGCGNFLVISYRELRLLEIEILKELNKYGQDVTDISLIMNIDVDQFYGIEIEEFPARIAEVAMWLIDHQMNIKVSEEFGQYFVRLPLKKSANITVGNALEINWQSLLHPINIYNIYANHTNIYVVKEPEVEYKTINVQTKTFEVIEGEKPEPKPDIMFDYILGNPPFVGKKEQNSKQKSDLRNVLKNINGINILDYVTAWYVKAAEYIQNTNIKVAFVSTNSITQGEQVSIIWKFLLQKCKIKIHFAHRTFKWSNEGKANAAVHVIIIGFACFDIAEKRIFIYESSRGEPQELIVKKINPYLIESKDIFVDNRNKPICNVPSINYGSMPIDSGHLILSDNERTIALNSEPELINLIRPYTGGDEFINDKKRWCLWLENVSPSILRKSKFVYDRLEKTKKFRFKSNRLATRKLAEIPMLFGEIRQPKTDYIIIPKVSSENRKYIPIGILNSSIITSGSVLIVTNANLFIFGVLISYMHSCWMKTTCGRMKSDYQYSASVVYNNFPWPENPSEKLKSNVEKAAQKVLDVRKKYQEPSDSNKKPASLADLYNVLTMPPDLVKAHDELDKAVDLCYRSQPFTTEAKRMEYLFELYEKYTTGLFSKDKKSKKKNP
jgi:hypothetical protein